MIEVKELETMAELIAVRFPRLASERAELAASGASPEEIARHDSIVSALMDAQKLLLARSAELRAEEERAAKYAKIYPEACRLKEEMDKAFHAHERANLEYVTAENNLQSAEVALSEHMGNKPRPETFPSARAKASWETRRQAFEKHRDERKEIVRKKREEMGEARAENQRLRAAFDTAAFQCRYYGPRTPSAKPVPTAWSVPSPTATRTNNSPV